MIVLQGRLEGIFAERDLVFRLMAKGRGPRATALAEIMTRDPETLRPDDSALPAFDKMRVGRYRHLPVVDGVEIAGMVSIRSLGGCSTRSCTPPRA